MSDKVEKLERATLPPKPVEWVREDLLVVALIVVILLVGASMWSRSMLGFGGD